MKEPPRSAYRRSSGDDPSDRLDSWKDIAAYLKRDVSTVQRWEKREGMPVHRHVHDKLGSVYAFRSELDGWRGRASQLTDETQDVSAPASAVSEPQPDVHPDADAAAPRPDRRLGVVVALALGLIVTIALVLRFGPTRQGPKLDISSLAVLPLDSLSDDSAQEYLADGITDALIGELGKIPSLRVIARSSVMKYKGTDPRASEVARELGVDAVVAGSVLRSGNRIRIGTSLVDPASNRQIWSDTIERDAQDVLTLQREVAAAIADHIRARLPESARIASGKVGRVDPAAYDSVLRARYLSVRTTEADNKDAIALLQRAIALDPGFAAAHAELAKAQVVRLAYVTPDETRDLEQKAFASAENALSLDPELPEAYLARGDLLWSHSHRFAHERAVREFRRALALNPNSDQAHQRLARVYVHLGFFEETLQHAAMALSINPSNAQALNSRAQATLWMGNDEEALAILLSIPGPVLPELVEANTAFALLRLRRPREAWTQLETAARKYRHDVSGNLLAMRALLLAESDPHQAEQLLAGVKTRKPVNPAHHAAYFAAAASARMGRAQNAAQWLREAADSGFPCYRLFATDPNLNRVRRDPHFVAFMEDMQKRSASLRKALFEDAT